MFDVIDTEKYIGIVLEMAGGESPTLFSEFADGQVESYLTIFWQAGT